MPSEVCIELGNHLDDKFIGEVWRRRPVYTFEHKYCEFEVNPLPLPSASEVDGGAE